LPSDVQHSFTLVQKCFIKEHVFEFDFAARVDRGLVRKSNQDVARVIPRLGLALVADGMGGHDHGHIASQVAADVLEERFDALGGAGANADESAKRLQAAFRDANQALAEHPASRQGPAKMGTTLVAAVFAHGRAVIGNIGDSRCYRFQNGSIEILTQDHSYAAQLEQLRATATSQGREAAGQWAHVLTRCLNGDHNVTPDMRISRCEPGDIYLLCSDGLWGAVSDDVIGAILGAAEDAEAACEDLVSAAWAGSGLDNIGVAIVRLVPQQLRLDKPSWLEQPTQPGDQPAGDA
jgi:PPM family protein phosphatase